MSYLTTITAALRALKIGTSPPCFRDRNATRCLTSLISRGFSASSENTAERTSTATQKRRWPTGIDGLPIKTAKARKLGISTSQWKLNLLARLVRGVAVEEAVRRMAGTRKKHRDEIVQTVKAAIVNAKSYGMDLDRLIVSQAYVTKGRYLKKIRPWHGKGRYGIERKRYCHLTIEIRELNDEEWDAKVMPQYIHLGYKLPNASKERDVPKDLVKPWLIRSQLDDSLISTKRNVDGLRSVLPKRRHPFPDDWKCPASLSEITANMSTADRVG